MFTYRQAGDGVMRSDGAFVPNDPENPDWAAYTDWVADGNSADDALQEDLADAKSSATAFIEREAGVRRRASIGGSIDLAWWSELIKEAEAVGSDTKVTAGEYPLLEAEVPKRGADVAAAATAVLAERPLILAAWGAINAVKNSKQAEVAAETTVLGIRTAIASIPWPGSGA